jgi:hypothetical protein
MKIPSEGAIEDKLTFGMFCDTTLGAYSMDIGPARETLKIFFRRSHVAF